MSHDLRNTGFDAFASNYEETLRQGIAISGEDKNFFAHGRVQWLDRCLKVLNFKSHRILDFGSGTGTAIPYLLEIGAEVTAVDTSPASLEVARKELAGRHGNRVSFQLLEEFDGAACFDLVYCNGVFHHIPPAEREDVLRKIWQSLRPGGCFALWENNPWNPATRIVMSRIPFDRDAETLSPPLASRLLRSVGFEVVRQDFLFYFPRALAFMRPLEAFLRSLPLGAQYQTLGRKG